MGIHGNSWETFQRNLNDKCKFTHRIMIPTGCTRSSQSSWQVVFFSAAARRLELVRTSLVGGFSPSPLKNDGLFVSRDDELPNMNGIYGKIKAICSSHHQPVVRTSHGSWSIGILKEQSHRKNHFKMPKIGRSIDEAIDPITSGQVVNEQRWCHPLHQPALHRKNMSILPLAL